MTNEEPRRYAVKAPHRRARTQVLRAGEIVELVVVCPIVTCILYMDASFAEYAIVRAHDQKVYALGLNAVVPLTDDLWAFVEGKDAMQNIMSPDKTMLIAMPTLRSLEELNGDQFRLKVFRLRGGAWTCVHSELSGLAPP